MSLPYQIYKSLIYKSIKTKNRFKKLLSTTPKQKYLFILSPPYSGSTLLQEILSTSSMISPNNIFDTREGQQLPELKDTMFVKGRFEASFQVDWKLASDVWHQYWDPTAPILMDKSPANIVRATEIEQFFILASFLVLVRDPYAQCESLMRKNNWTAKRSAEFAVQCLQHQRNNLEMLKRSTLLTYEEMTDNKDKVISAVNDLFPEVNDLHFNKKFKAHNFRNEQLEPTNLNSQKIKSLGRGSIAEINLVFNDHEALLDHFGYQLRK